MRKEALDHHVVPGLHGQQRVKAILPYLSYSHSHSALLYQFPTCAYSFTKWRHLIGCTSASPRRHSARRRWLTAASRVRLPCRSRSGFQLTLSAEVSLASYTEANHWLILIFFPKAWSFICPTEIRAFSARLEEFLYSRSCAVVFCSTDSEHCLKAWNATSGMEGGLGGVHVPLVSDCNQRISRDYGVLIEDQGVAQRALFIIDPKGTIRSISINDADVGRSVDETQRVLDALVFKDNFGEGCPVDWKKGDKGIDTSTKVEGKVELKKSWSEWARPKLSRAWSATSQRSIGGTMTTQPASRVASPPNEILTGYSKSGSISASGSPGNLHSPTLSPTSANGMQNHMDGALMQQRMENLRASHGNSELPVGFAS